MATTLADEQERMRRQLLAPACAAVDGAGTLPGQIEVARRLGANRQQVRHAMDALEHQGVRRRRHGAATIVDPMALRMTVRLEDQIEHSVLLDRLGYDTAVDVLQAEIVNLAADIASERIWGEPVVREVAVPSAIALDERPAGWADHRAGGL